MVKLVGGIFNLDWGSYADEAKTIVFALFELVKVFI
jgi:hypothetical protein